MAEISKEPWTGNGFCDLENYLAERLDLIEGGEGHWARCMQAIERYAAKNGKKSTARKERS